MNSNRAALCEFGVCPDGRRSWPTHHENFISDSEVAALAARNTARGEKNLVQVPEDFGKRGVIVERGDRMAGRIS